MYKNIIISLPLESYDYSNARETTIEAIKSSKLEYENNSDNVKVFNISVDDMYDIIEIHTQLPVLILNTTIICKKDNDDVVITFPFENSK